MDAAPPLAEAVSARRSRAAITVRVSASFASAGGEEFADPLRHLRQLGQPAGGAVAGHEAGDLIGVVQQRAAGAGVGEGFLAGGWGGGRRDCEMQFCQSQRAGPQVDRIQFHQG
jgi:hypothetical protein